MEEPFDLYEFLKNWEPTGETCDRCDNCNDYTDLYVFGVIGSDKGWAQYCPTCTIKVIQEQLAEWSRVFIASHWTEKETPSNE